MNKKHTHFNNPVADMAYYRELKQRKQLRSQQSPEARAEADLRQSLLPQELTPVVFEEMREVSEFYPVLKMLEAARAMAHDFHPVGNERLTFHPSVIRERELTQLGGFEYTNDDGFRCLFTVVRHRDIDSDLVRMIDELTMQIPEEYRAAPMSLVAGSALQVLQSYWPSKPIDTATPFQAAHRWFSYFLQLTNASIVTAQHDVHGHSDFVEFMLRLFDPVGDSYWLRFAISHCAVPVQEELLVELAE